MNLRLLLLVSILLSGPAVAGEAKVYTYEFPVAGVVCSACSRVVKDSIRKVPGVVDVRIVPQPNGELPRLTVTATEQDLKADHLQAALGDASKIYQIGEAK